MALVENHVVPQPVLENVRVPHGVEKLNVSPRHSIGRQQHVEGLVEQQPNLSLAALLDAVKQQNGHIYALRIQNGATGPAFKCLFPHRKYTGRDDEETRPDLFGLHQTLQIHDHLDGLSQSHVVGQKGAAIHVVVHSPEPLHALDLVRVPSSMSTERMENSRDFTSSGMLSSSTLALSVAIVCSKETRVDETTASIAMSVSTALQVSAGHREDPFVDSNQSQRPPVQRQQKCGNKQSVYKPLETLKEVKSGHSSLHPGLSCSDIRSFHRIIVDHMGKEL